MILTVFLLVLLGLIALGMGRRGGEQHRQRDGRGAAAGAEARE